MLGRAMLMAASNSAVAALWTPAQITTALWLDAADAATITTVSGAVSQWNDKSGNARHATQATADQRPSYGARSLNGIVVPDFDGTNDNMSLPNGTVPSGSSPYHFAFVAFANSEHRGHLVYSGNFASNQANAFRVGNQTNERPTSYWYANDLGANISYANTATIFATEWGSSAQDFIYVNGSTAATGSRSGRNSTTGNNRIGAGYASTHEPFNGPICEALIMPNALSTSVRQQVEGYLAWKWSIQGSLPAGHPYKSAAPTA